MNPRYQIFVSSTFQDLKDARERVIYELMRNGFIAVGMEQFHASDEEQMEYISPLIDQTDYYVVIVKGRYGSLAADGMSYTEKEYRYAVERGVPVLAFLFEDLKSLSIQDTGDDPEKLKKFKAFREELAAKRMVSFWGSEDDLVSKVKDAVFGIAFRKPRAGWIRGDQALDPSVYKELETARKRIEQLEARIATLDYDAVQFPDDLVHGSDTFKFTGRVRGWPDHSAGPEEIGELSVEVSWDFIFEAIVESLYREASEHSIKFALGGSVGVVAMRAAGAPIKQRYSYRMYLPDSDVIAIRFHLQALGLLTTGVRQDEDGNNFVCWYLTEKGRKYIANLKAIRREVVNVTPAAPPP